MTTTSEEAARAFRNWLREQRVSLVNTNVLWDELEDKLAALIRAREAAVIENVLARVRAERECLIAAAHQHLVDKNRDASIELLGKVDALEWVDDELSALAKKETP